MNIDKNREYQQGNLIFVNYTQLPESDLLTILDFRNHISIRQMSYNDNGITKEQHFSFIEKLKLDVNNFYFAIKKNNKIIGSVSLTKCDFIKKYIFAGVFLDPKLIGSGLGVELEFECVNLAFEKFKIEIAGCEVFEDNEFAQKLISALNFRKIETHPTYSTYQLIREDWLKLSHTYKEFKLELLKNIRKNK